MLDKDEQDSMMIDKSIQYSSLANMSQDNEEEPINTEPIYSNESHTDAEADVVTNECDDK